jgi:hypothetical protein
MSDGLKAEVASAHRAKASINFKQENLKHNQARRRSMNKFGNKLMQCCSFALLTLFIAASAQAQTPDAASEAARAKITPPSVPGDIQVEEGNEAFLIGHATGTQNYSCQPCVAGTEGCDNGVAFALFTPQATLFNDNGKQIITHFNSPNPIENNLVRATWQHSQDTSRIWAKITGSATVSRTAIAWLRLQVKEVGALAGPTGGRKLTGTTFIQRVNTSGGLAPATGCNSPADLGAKAFVPYTADYVFYKKADEDERNKY